MIKKIKIKSISKTNEYLEREWSKVMSKKHYLLSMSDWTQMEDNELTFESRVRWNHWRGQVRNVKRNNFENISNAETELERLEKTQPKNEFIQHISVRQNKYQCSLETLSQAKTDAINILKQLHNEWVIKLLPENYDSIISKYYEVLRYFETKPKSLEDFPLISVCAEMSGLSIDDTVQLFMNLKRVSDEMFVSMERHKHKFLLKINDCETVDEVIDTIKEMHGY